MNLVVYTTIDQTLVNSLNGLLNCEIGGLDCRVYNIHVSIVYTCITFLQCIGPCNLFRSFRSIFVYNILQLPKPHLRMVRKCKLDKEQEMHFEPLYLLLILKTTVYSSLINTSQGRPIQ